MAVPTIISISPNELVSNTRQQVFITGTNFKLWPSLPWPNGGVFVYFVFGAEEFLCRNIQVVSSTEIRVEAFRYMGDPKTIGTTKASVKVVNLDANGDPVPGESATLAAAVSYYKDQFVTGDKNTGDDFLRLAIEEVIQTFRRSIDVPVAVATHVDWFEEGSLEHFVAEFPTIAFAGFSLEPIPHTPYDPDRDRTEGEVEEYLPSEYFWVRWTVVPMTDDPRELMGLWSALVRLSQRVRQVFIPKSQGSTDRMEVEFSLDPAGDLGFNYGVGGTVTLNAKLGPIPLESPEVVNRLWDVQEAFLNATGNVEGTGEDRDTQFYP